MARRISFCISSGYTTADIHPYKEDINSNMEICICKIYSPYSHSVDQVYIRLSTLTHDRMPALVHICCYILRESSLGDMTRNPLDMCVHSRHHNQTCSRKACGNTAYNLRVSKYRKSGRALERHARTVKI